MRHYTHLSLEERATIGLYYNKGLSLGEISKEVGRDKSTLSRELRRNSNQQTYVATTACKRYLSRRQKPSRLDQDEILKTYVTDRLREGLSPEIISLRLKRFGHLEGVAYVNPESIYQWLYRPPQKKEKLHKLLVRGHGNRGHRKRVHGSKIKGRVSIHERPEAAKGRQEIGHWEVDLMAFLRNSQHMLVIHERKTRYTAAIKLANKTAAETLKALLSFFQGLPEDLLKTITFDNGTEFAYHQNLSDILKVPTYFCDVYASWQKGGIENMNGRFRRDLPRKTDLKAMCDKEFEQIILNHNLMPRKCLKAKSPIEALAKHLKKDIVFLFNQGVALQL